MPKDINLSLIGPVKVSWVTRHIFSGEVTEHLVMMYWQGDNELVQLEPLKRRRPLSPKLMNGQPISVSDIEVYLVKMIEAFNLPPSRIFSPFEGMVAFSNTGFAGFRYLVERENNDSY